MNVNLDLNPFIRQATTVGGARHYRHRETAHGVLPSLEGEPDLGGAAAAAEQYVDRRGHRPRLVAGPPLPAARHAKPPSCRVSRRSVRRAPFRAASSFAPRPRRARAALAPRLASFVWHGGSPRSLPLAVAARFLTRVLFWGSALGRGAGGGGDAGAVRGDGTRSIWGALVCRTQWIERQNGIWAHWPPRPKPEFMCHDAA